MPVQVMEFVAPVVMVLLPVAIIFGIMERAVSWFDDVR